MMLKNLLQIPVRAFLDQIVQNDQWRKYAMRYAERKLYEGIIEDNPVNRSTPRRAREDEYITFKNMLSRLSLAMDKGLIAPQVRKKLLNTFVGRVILKDNPGIAAFEKQYHLTPPGFLLIAPSGGCNLQCIGCFANSPRPGEGQKQLDYDLVSAILRQKRELWGSYFNLLSGGEPLLWRSQGKSVLDLVREHNDQYFMMYTNGTLIDQATAEAMAELGNISPAISMEGFEAETDARRGEGTFRKIGQAFVNLRRAGVPFGISLTATRHNADRLLNDDFLTYCFEEQGAVYGWLYQYMPIGRRYTLDLMITPEQRVAMYEREQKLVRERGYFLVDFWNSGPVTHGCISAGRGGGYFYIDWKGDVMPCAFFPYSAMNIKEVFAAGGDLNTVLFSPFFKAIRDWQFNYGLDPSKPAGNMIMPCPIRDHHREARELIRAYRAKPADEPAREAWTDEHYHSGLEEYDRKFEQLSSRLWKREYLEADAPCSSASPALDPCQGQDGEALA